MINKDLTQRKSKFFAQTDNKYEIFSNGIDVSIKSANSFQDRSYIPGSTPRIQSDTIQAFRLLFDDIANANLLVGDATNVSDWNSFLDLPSFGNPFISVEVVGNEVKLYGGNNITIKENTFFDDTYLIEVIDGAGCVIAINTDSFSYQSNITTLYFPECVDITGGAYIDAGAFYLLTSLTSMYFPKLEAIDNQCFADCDSLTTIDLPNLISAGDDSFYGCNSLTSVNLPLLTTAGDYCFAECINLITISLPLIETVGHKCFQHCQSLTSISLPNLTAIGDYGFSYCSLLTSISLPLCTDLGGSVGDDFVFSAISGNNITLTVPSALMTCNSGSPDGDIQYLQANNTVTIITT